MFLYDTYVYTCLQFVFQVYMVPHNDAVNLITMYACVLHNLIFTRHTLLTIDVDHTTHALIPGSWREDPHLHGFTALSGNTSIKEAKDQRDYLSLYSGADAEKNLTGFQPL